MFYVEDRSKWHDVEIPMSTTYWEDELWVSKRFMDLSRYNDWLRDNDIDMESVKYVFLKCLMPDGNHGFLFSFRKVSDALLFKLTWGGL